MVDYLGNKFNIKGPNLSLLVEKVLNKKSRYIAEIIIAIN